jgi:ABC-type phosphate transport system permease subunit
MDSLKQNVDSDARPAEHEAALAAPAALNSLDKHVPPSGLFMKIVCAFMLVFIAIGVGGMIAAIGVGLLAWANNLWKSGDVIWSLLVAIPGVIVFLNGLGFFWSVMTENFGGSDTKSIPAADRP